VGQNNELNQELGMVPVELVMAVVEVSVLASAVGWELVSALDWELVSVLDWELVSVSVLEQDHTHIAHLHHKWHPSRSQDRVSKVLCHQ